MLTNNVVLPHMFSIHHLFLKSCLVSVFHAEQFEIFASQENNVKACLPLDFTQEQYDNEDRK